MRNIRRGFSLLLLALFALKAFYSAAHAQVAEPEAAGRMCTEMWCDEGFELRFDTAQWQKGSYRIDMDVDGAVISCTAQLPLPPCGEPAYSCNENNLDVMVTTEGCALPASAHRLGGVRMKTVPKHFDAKVIMPDGSLREASGAVDAQCGYPNGQECDHNMCCSAKAALSLQ